MQVYAVDAAEDPEALGPTARLGRGAIGKTRECSAAGVQVRAGDSFLVIPGVYKGVFSSSSTNYYKRAYAMQLLNAEQVLERTGNPDLFAVARPTLAHNFGGWSVNFPDFPNHWEIMRIE